MYAGAAFVVIELINNVVEPLSLPVWIPTIVILLLIIGFPIVAILSWIFDLTPEGVKKTAPVESLEESQYSIESGRRKLKPSDIVIAVLVIAVGILVYPKIFNKAALKGVRDPDGKISVAVMPFENNDVLKNNKNISIASLTPALTKDITNKLDVRSLILGNILKAGNRIRVNAQLVDAESEEIYKTYQVDCASENDLFTLADSLSGMIKNFIEIKKISDEYNMYEIQGNSLTNSSEAFKNYIRGVDAFKYVELESAADWFTKAIEEDSAFISAYILNAYANLMNGQDRQAKYWANKVIEKRVDLPIEEQIRVDQLNAYFFETPSEEIKYSKQLIEIDNLNPLYWHQLGFAYFKLYEYEDAVNSWEQIFKIHEKWGTNYQNPYVYFMMGNAYHKLDEHEKEKKILALGNQVFPNAIMIQQHQAICAFSRGDHAKAEEILVEYKSIRQNILHCTEAMISSGVGAIYTESGMMERADASYQEAIEKDPENLYWISEYAWFLVDNDFNIEKGLKLADQILEQFPEHWPTLDTKGWGLYKQGKLEAALTLLKDSWDLKPAYSHNGYLHILEIEQAVAKHTGEI